MQLSKKVYTKAAFICATDNALTVLEECIGRIEPLYAKREGCAKKQLAKLFTILRTTHSKRDRFLRITFNSIKNNECEVMLLATTRRQETAKQKEKRLLIEQRSLQRKLRSTERQLELKKKSIESLKQRLQKMKLQTNRDDDGTHD